MSKGDRFWFEYGYLELPDGDVLVRYRIRDDLVVLKVRLTGPQGFHLENCQVRLQASPAKIQQLMEGELVVV